ncbi:MAG: type I-D CRISPR-associated protein Cas10d/Csc3, partial [Anaerolineae bacterium]
MEEEDVYDLEDLEEPEPEVGRQPREAIVLPDEPLFAALLRREVERQWPGDAVMADLMQHVAAPLSDTLGHVAAKGGAFAREREAQGTGDERYSRDQSQRAHLVNGLLPTLHVARALQQWGAPQLRAYDDTARRLFIAGHILHDYLKLPGVEQQLEGAGFDYQRAVGPAQMPLLEEILRAWCRELGLDRFLEPAGGAEAYLHDLLYIACNTQTRWGTLRNLSLLPRLRLPAVQRDLAEQLSRLADLLAYVARTPVAACAHPGIHRELTTLSDGLARLAYHHVSEIRGVMTNLIHNAALKALASPQRVPLLFAPSGVVYLEHKKAPAPPSVQVVAEETVQVVRETARHALQLTPRGMQRDGKGIKCAGYYPLCFAPAELVVLGARAIFRLIREGKASSASKRFAKMRGQRWLDASADLDLPDDLRVDQLAEWCALAEQQVREQLPGFDTASFLLQHFGLQDLGETFRAVPRDNRAGGVPYHWYLAAGNYLKRHPGLDPTAWQERIEGAARALAAALPPVDRPLPVAEQTWQELRDYVARVLTVGAGTAGAVSAFADELRRYTAAK